MTRKKDTECCDASVQHLSLVLVFSEAYQIKVSGSTCILHDTIKLPLGKKWWFCSRCHNSFYM